MTRPRTTRVLAPVLLAFTLAIVSGCAGAHPVRDRAQAVEVAARVLEGAAQALDLAAYHDARSTCPTAEAQCLAEVGERWAPADASLAVARDGLSIWLAGGSPDAFGAAWADLVRLARAFGVEI